MAEAFFPIIPKGITIILGMITIRTAASVSTWKRVTYQLARC